MDISKIKIGDQAPAEFNVIIEISQGSAIKYEIEETTGELEVDRLLGSSFSYPYNYGYIPETLAPDGDALDALVISSAALEPKTAVVCRPIGLLEMEDEHGGDAKILCVPINEIDPAYIKIKDLADLDLAVREKIKLFFAQYKEREKSRWSKARNFSDKAEAIKTIDLARAEFKKS